MLVHVLGIKMNFGAEIALLQGSFCCPETDLDRQTSARRTHVQQKQGNVSVTAICHAVREIVRGLEHDRCEAEKRHWNFKLHAVLFFKLLERRKREEEDNGADEKIPRQMEDGDCWLRCFEGVSRALPDYVSLSVYLDVASTCEWGPFCAQVLSSIDLRVAQDILEDIIAECITENHPDLLIDILTGLLIPLSREPGGNTPPGWRHSSHGSNLLNHSTTKLSLAAGQDITMHTCSRLAILACEQIFKASSKIKDAHQRLEVIQAMVTCLNCLILDLQWSDMNKDKQETLDRITCSHWKNSLEFSAKQDHWNDRDFTSDIYKLHLLSSARQGDLIHRSDQEEALLLCKGAHSGEVEAIQRRELLFAAVTKLVSTLHGLLTVDWADFFVDAFNSSAPRPDSGITPKTIKTATDLQVRLTLAKDKLRVLHRLHKCLDDISAFHSIGHVPTDFEVMQQKGNDLAAYLSDILEQVDFAENSVPLAEKLTVAMEMDQPTSSESEHVWFQKAISRVDARLEGYEEDLGQLLSSIDQWEDASWIECLERNAPSLALPGLVKQLIGVVMTMDARGIDEDVVLQRVLKVLLASFSTLPFLLQNKLRDHLWSYPNGATVFARRCVSIFDQSSILAFNRLVTLARGQENTEVLTALSCLALQFPAQTLRQAVSRAVSNAAVCQAVCQVLQAMPSLATFKLAGDQWPLLCQLIRKAMETSATTASEEANLVQLVTALLQPYKSFLDPQCPFWSPPVLPAQGVTQVCVLPHLLTSLAHPSCQNHLSLALKFLSEVINVQEVWTRNSNQFVYGVSQFPIMLSLCEILDSCHLLWDDVALMIEKPDVKETVLGLLGRIGRMVMTMHDSAETERGISWLINRITATMHWTTALAVQELLPDAVQHQVKLVPASLCGICSLPDSAWSAISHNETPQRSPSLCDQLTDLLLCCRTSNTLAAVLTKSIQVPEGTSSDGFLEALTLALVQVLPHSIMGEWQCIMGMLKQLLANGDLLVPCSARYVTSLPVVDISDFSVHLGLSHLLLSVMQLLTRPCCQDWASPQLLHHVTRCYVNAMQNLASEVLNSDLASAPGCLFVIGQFFCHACEVVSCLPMDDLKEQVFVLTLEYLSQLEEVTPGHISKKTFSHEWTHQIEDLVRLTNQKLEGGLQRTLLQKLSCIRQGTGQ